MATDGMSHWLEGLPDEELTVLVERRLGRVPQLPRSFDQLALLLSQPHSCDEAVRQLDRTAVQVTALLAERGGRGAAADLADGLGSPPEVVGAALARAEVLGLAWPGAAGTWRAAAGLRHLAPVLLARGPSYLELLEETRLQGLRVLLKAHGLGGARSARDAVEALSAALPQLVPQLLAELPGAAEALREVAVSGVLPGDELGA